MPWPYRVAVTLARQVRVVWCGASGAAPTADSTSCRCYRAVPSVCAFTRCSWPRRRLHTLFLACTVISWPPAPRRQPTSRPQAPHPRPRPHPSDTDKQPRGISYSSSGSLFTDNAPGSTRSRCHGRVAQAGRSRSTAGPAKVHAEPQASARLALPPSRMAESKRVPSRHRAGRVGASTTNTSRPADGEPDWNKRRYFNRANSLGATWWGEG
jgi:hypothetical protein